MDHFFLKAHQLDDTNRIVNLGTVESFEIKADVQAGGYFLCAQFAGQRECRVAFHETVEECEAALQAILSLPSHYGGRVVVYDAESETASEYG